MQMSLGERALLTITRWVTRAYAVLPTCQESMLMDYNNTATTVTVLSMSICSDSDLAFISVLTPSHRGFPGLIPPNSTLVL